MKIALISSATDPAGRNIHRHIHTLLDAGTYTRPGREYQHIVVDGRLIFEDGIDRSLDADLIIFLSRHASVNPVPVLTVHVTGNFSGAELGGVQGSLAPAAPTWMHAVLRNLELHRPTGYSAMYEVTHHGPTEISTPSFFVEIGSTDHEWTDERAGDSVARSVLMADPSSTIPLIGFGGTHYAKRETEIALASQGAFGHIAHTREVTGLTPAMVSLMTGRTGAVGAYIDRNALDGKTIAGIETMVKSAGIPCLRGQEITDLGSLPWTDYLRVRDLAQSAVPGGSLHVHSVDRMEKPVLVCINPDLVSAAFNAGGSQFVAALEKIPLVHLSTPSQPVVPRVIADESKAEEILHDLITLCVSNITVNEETAFEEDQLIILKKKMDPLKARELGVPAGPLFGLLMRGETVRIGEREITPDMVQVSSRKAIHIPGLERYT